MEVHSTELAASSVAALCRALPPEDITAILETQQATLASLRSTKASLAQQTIQLQSIANKLEAAVGSTADDLSGVRANMDTLHMKLRQVRRLLRAAGVQVPQVKLVDD